MLPTDPTSLAWTGLAVTGALWAVIWRDGGFRPQMDPDASTA